MRVVEENKQKAVTMKPIEIILAIEKRVKTLYIIVKVFYLLTNKFMSLHSRCCESTHSYFLLALLGLIIRTYW